MGTSLNKNLQLQFLKAIEEKKSYTSEFKKVASDIIDGLGKMDHNGYSLSVYNYPDEDMLEIACLKYETKPRKGIFIVFELENGNPTVQVNIAHNLEYRLFKEAANTKPILEFISDSFKHI